MLHYFEWQGGRDSNPQPTVLETATLPIELPPYMGRVLTSSRGVHGGSGTSGNTCSARAGRSSSAYFSAYCNCDACTRCTPSQPSHDFLFLPSQFTTRHEINGPEDRSSLETVSQRPSSSQGRRCPVSQPLLASPSGLRSCCAASSLSPSKASLVGPSLLDRTPAALAQAGRCGGCGINARARS